MTEPLRADILAALNAEGELTQEQLRELIDWEAGQFGMTYEQAIDAAERNGLPKTALGSDVDLLVQMLQWLADPPDGVVSPEELAAMDRYGAEACVEAGCYARHLAEAQGEAHLRYHREVEALAGRGEDA